MDNFCLLALELEHLRLEFRRVLFRSSELENVDSKNATNLNRGVDPKNATDLNRGVENAELENVES